MKRGAGIGADGRPSPVSHGEGDQGHGRGLFSRPVKWAGGIIAAAVAGVITSVVVGLPGQLFDSPSVKDKVRSGPEIRLNANVIRLDDEGATTIMPGDYQPDPQLARRLATAGAGANAQVMGPLLKSGVNLRNLTLQIVAEGRRNQEIRVINIKPVVRARTVPIDGTLFYIFSQGEENSSQMTVNLDQPAPVVREHLGAGSSSGAGEPYFAGKTISLRTGEQQTIILRTTTARFYVVFDVQVDYLIGGKSKTVMLTNSGKHYRVTAPHCDPRKATWSYRRNYEIQGDFSILPTTSSIINQDGGYGCRPKP